MKSLEKVLILSFSILILASGNAGATVFNVTPQSGGGCSDATPDNCTLQEALDVASGNQMGDTINLAAGTYSTNDNGDMPFNYTAQPAPDENFPLSIIGAGKDMTILDGGGTPMVPGDPVLFLVTLGLGNDSNAHIEVRDLSANNGNSTIFSSTSQADILLQGLGLNNNLFVLSATSDGGNFTAENCMLIGSGSIIGLLSTNTGEINFQNNSIEDSDTVNPANGFLISSSTGEINVTDNLFSGPFFGLFSSISSSMGTINFNNNEFTDVTSPISLISVSNSMADIHFNENEFSQCFGGTLFQLINDSGAIRANANGLFQNGSSFSDLNMIQNNTGPIVWTNNIIAMNNSSSRGSVLNTSSGTVTVTNNTIYGNIAGADSGGLLVTLEEDTATANFFNNILLDNNLSNFVGPAGKDLSVSDDGNGNDTGSPVVISNNDLGSFFSDCEQNNPPCMPDITQTNNINEDPLFANPALWDFNLSPGSPAIGAGDANAPELPTNDFANRPLNNPPDLGALAAVSMLSVNPLAIAFGDVSTEVPASRTLTLENSGGKALNVTGMTLSDTENFSLQTDGMPDACGSTTPTLDPGQSCVLQIVFNPGTDGAVVATLSIETDELGNPTIVVDLTGNGVDTSSGDGCSLGSTLPSNAYAFLALIPLFWVALRFRNFRK